MEKELIYNKGYVAKYCDVCKRQILSGVAKEISKEFPDICGGCRG